MLKFYYNGIKEDGGKLQKCSYYLGQLISYPSGTITIYGKHYKDFSKGVHEVFKVENGTDIMTDYFEDDRIRVEPTHPLYAAVLESYQKQEQKRAARYAKKEKE